MLTSSRTSARSSRSCSTCRSSMTQAIVAPIRRAHGARIRCSPCGEHAALPFRAPEPAQHAVSRRQAPRTTPGTPSQNRADCRLRDSRQSSPPSGRSTPRLAAGGRGVDARWTSKKSDSWAPAESNRAARRRKRAIDDLTTKWIAADRRPARAETASRRRISQLRVDSNHRPHDYESCSGCEPRRSAVKLGQGCPGNRAVQWYGVSPGIAGRVRKCRRLDVVGAPVCSSTDRKCATFGGFHQPRKSRRSRSTSVTGGLSRSRGSGSAATTSEGASSSRRKGGRDGCLGS